MSFPSLRAWWYRIGRLESDQSNGPGTFDRGWKYRRRTTTYPSHNTRKTAVHSCQLSGAVARIILARNKVSGVSAITLITRRYRCLVEAN
jgi:hypothetical protein